MCISLSDLEVIALLTSCLNNVIKKIFFFFFTLFYLLQTFKMKELNCFSLVFFISFLCVCERVFSADILYMSTTSSPSHNIWDKTLAVALKDRGHHITYVTHFPEKSTDNFTVIILEGVYNTLLLDFDLESTVNTSTTENVQMLFDWIHITCQLDLKTNGLKQVLELAKQNKKFDLIIFDITLGPCFFPIVELFKNPPLVATTPFGIPPYLALNFGIDLQTSYVPHYSVGYTGRMNFIERMYNYFIELYEISLKYYYWGKMKEMLDEYYGKDVKHIYEVEKNFSIMLPNYDPILDYPRPLPPDVIPVGGLHTKRSKTLPQDLEKYLDNSKDGVIMFSLGTNVRSDKLKPEKRKVILETFAKLKQNIVWKFESDISDLPKNVIVRKFLPQNDILAHPNVKLLINHGGGLSTQEAMYHGVPLVTIPFFIDQRMISHKVVNRKIGLSLNYENITVDYMLSTIREVINNPIYTQNIQKISRTFRDRPDSPLDRAVFWVEHVLRQGGAKHFRLPARHMPFYQTHHLDIWMLLIGILILGIVIIRKICCKFLVGHKSKVTKLKSN